MKKINNSGFSLSSIAVAIVSFALVVSVGLYVRSKTKTPESQPSTKPSSNIGDIADSTPSVDVDSQNQFLVIKQWDIKLANVAANKMTYNFIARAGTDAQGSSYESKVTPLIKAQYLTDKTCQPGVNLYRSSRKPEFTSPVKIGGYYYWAGGGPGPCNNQPDNDLKLSIVSDFTADKLEAL